MADPLLVSDKSEESNFSAMQSRHAAEDIYQNIRFGSLLLKILLPVHQVRNDGMPSMVNCNPERVESL